LPAAIPSSSRPAAKRQQIRAQRTINQLLYIDLTANNNDNNSNGGKDGKGSKGAKKIQDKIVAIMPGFINLLFD